MTNSFLRTRIRNKISELYISPYLISAQWVFIYSCHKLLSDMIIK